MQVKVEPKQEFETITITLTVEKETEYRAFQKMSQYDLSIPMLFRNKEEKDVIVDFLNQLNKQL